MTILHDAAHPSALRFAGPEPDSQLLDVREADQAGAVLGETGASAVEWVVITALLVGIAVAVGAILLNTITDKANSIDLG